MASIRWGFVFQGPRLSATDIQRGIAAYGRRFGRDPVLMVVNRDHLVEGLQMPLGLAVEGDRRVNRAILEFELPEDRAPAADDLDQQAAAIVALFSSEPALAAVFPIAFPIVAQLGDVNGATVWIAFLLLAVIGLALRQMIAAWRRGGHGQ